MKRYISMIVAFMMVLASVPFSIATAEAVTGDTYTLNISGTNEYSGPQEMMEYINEERALQGADPLTLDGDLTDAAMQRAAEIAYYFSHTRPDESEWGTVNRRAAGENIAVGTPAAESVYDSWKNSSGHYANMINNSFTNIGIGHFTHNGRHFWVQLFSRDSTKIEESRTGSEDVTAKINIIEKEGSPITFNNGIESVELLAGETFTLTAGAVNEEWTYAKCIFDADSFNWSSSDGSVAAVSEDGMISAVGVGTATVTAAVNNGSRTEISIPVNVCKDLSGASVSDLESIEYTGSAIEQKVTVTLDGQTLEEGKDYSIIYSNNVNAGTAYVTVNGMGGYKGTIKKSFKIRAKDVSELVEVKVNDWTYQSYGLANEYISDNTVVTLDGKPLELDDDYWISSVYTDTANKKVKNFDISFTGNYSGYKQMRCLEYAYMAPVPDQKPTGSEIRPEFMLYWDKRSYGYSGSLYRENIDYTVEYSDNIGYGTATIKILPAQNTYGTAEFQFRICDNIAEADITGPADAEYSGEPVEPGIQVTDEGNVLKRGEDYEIIYSNNINAGTATAVIKGIGRYGGEIPKTFNITPKNVTDTAEFKMRGWHYSDYPGPFECVKDNLKITIDGKSLEADKDYNVNNIRFSSINDSIRYFDVIFTGNYTGSKTIKNIDIASVNSLGLQFYTGQEIEPQIRLYSSGELTEGTDYTVEYADNVEPGTATVRITGKGDFYGTRELTFRIAKDFSKAEAGELPDAEFTGQEIKPATEVVYEGSILEEGTDYEIVYSDNINAGTVTAQIRGIGNYSGSILRTFDITPKEITGLVEWKLKGVDPAGYTNKIEFVEDNIQITHNGTLLVANKDFSVWVAGASNESGMLSDFAVTFKGNYTGELRARSMETLLINPIKDQHVTGRAITPEVKVYMPGVLEQQVEGIDYILEYTDNINAGTAAVKVTGIGDYFGTEEITFKITDHNYKWKTDKTAQIGSDGSKALYCEVCGKMKAGSKTVIPAIKSVTAAKLVYSGKSQSPKITVKDAKNNTISSSNYSISPASGKTTVGRYKVTVKFKGNYSGSREVSYAIVPKAPSSASATLNTVSGGYDDVTFSWKKSTGASGYLVYYKKGSGSWSKEVATKSLSYTKKNLSDGAKYTFKVVPYYLYGSTKYYSTAQYKTASVYTLKKLASPVVSKSGTKVKVKWKNISGETGYQISRSTIKSGTKVVATYKTTSGTYKTVSASKGKKYYYKVRAYKVVGSKKVYGPWSASVLYRR